MTLLSSLYLADTGYCSSISTEEECLVTRHLDQIDTLCNWSFENGCTFHKLHPSFLPLLILVIIICFVTLPFDCAYEFAVMKIQHFANTRATGIGLGSGVYGVDDPDIGEGELIFGLKNNRMVSMLLAARLEEMRDIMDRLHVVREMRELVKYATPENWHAPVPWISQQTRTARLATYFHEVRLHLSHNSDAFGASHVMHTKQNDLILSCLKKARLRAYLIKRNMAAFETDDEREVYIMQQFIVHSLRGFSNYI
jgi:hypothetical protein